MLKPNHCIVSAIVVMDENRVIGYQNSLPWHLPADLKHFKTLTSGKPILMGRKTYQSIGKPLPNRTNIVMTRDQTFVASGCFVVRSIQDAMAIAEQEHKDEIFIIGGAEIYQQLLPVLDRIYLTIVHHQFTGDTFFPALNHDEWVETENISYHADEANPYDLSFLRLEKK